MVSKLGMTTYAVPWACKGSEKEGVAPITPFGFLDKSAELGFTAVQICENLPLANLEPKELQRLVEAARQKGIELELGTRGLDVDYLKSELELAHAIGSKIMRMVPWSGAPERDPMTPERLRSPVKAILPVCEKYDIALAIENYFDITDQDLARFCREMNHPLVGVALDTANSVGLLQDPLQTAKALAPHTVSLHLKDFVVTKAPRVGYYMGGEAVGKGWADMAGVMKIVRESGREFNTMIELWVEEQKTHQATLELEDDMLEESVKYVREELEFDG